jgi:hypothetical protein
MSTSHDNLQSDINTLQLYSLCDEAFDQSGDLRRRGERFYREALKLWQSEQQTSHPSIVTMQALLMLALQ